MESLPWRANLVITAQVQCNALQKWWGNQQEKSKIAYFVANNPVTRTVVQGVTYDCHSVVTVSPSGTHVVLE